MAIEAIMLNGMDNVATAVQVLKAGQKVVVRMEREVNHVFLGEDIPYGHKFAVHLIRKGDEVKKYGEVIGRATMDINAGRHAHVQNIESLRGRGDLRGREEN
jgi:altronate dehydratase small subunit